MKIIAPFSCAIRTAVHLIISLNFSAVKAGNPKIYNGDNTGASSPKFNLQTILPVRWIETQASLSGNNRVIIKWRVIDEESTTGYVIEKSTDGKHYSKVIYIDKKDGYYSIIDDKIVLGITYHYRIKQVDIDGRSGYSKIMVVRPVGKNAKFFEIKPNPVSKILRWEANIMKAQYLQIAIIDVVGKQIMISKVFAHLGTNNFTTNVASLSSGAYMLKIRGENGEINTERFIVP